MARAYEAWKESWNFTRQWVLKFVTWYNNEHKHSGINFVTPMQRHKGEDTVILAKRHELYLQSRAKNPERWSGGTRNWSRAPTVVLHPDKNNTKTAAVNLEKAACRKPASILTITGTPRPLPMLKINSAVTDLFEIRFEDFELDGYNAGPSIAAPIAV